MASAWIFAGHSSDTAAGAEIDVTVFQSLGVGARVFLTALTAQSPDGVHAIEPISEAFLRAQAQALRAEPPPAAIKVGMLGDTRSAMAVVDLVASCSAPVVLDPVLRAGVGTPLIDEESAAILRRHLLPRARLFVPNRMEAEHFLGAPIEAPSDMPAAAAALLRLGPRECLLKGGHWSAGSCRDYWTDGKNELWLESPRQQVGPTHGTGCVLSSAVAAGLAQGLESPDAIIRAKAVLNRGLRLASRGGQRSYPIALPTWPQQAIALDLPRCGDFFPDTSSFPDCGGPLGFYPIADRAAWLDGLISRGVTTAQLRIKDRKAGELEREVRRAIAVARAGGCRLFINDYWELAAECGAYGVHLGQTDLDRADRAVLLQSGMRLGISTHNYREVTRAAAWRPSYIAVGPIFPTRLKVMPYVPQGIEALPVWKALVDSPLVAIGGLRLEHAAALKIAGADGIAVVNDWLGDARPLDRVTSWVQAVNL